MPPKGKSTKRQRDEGIESPNPTEAELQPAKSDDHIESEDAAEEKIVKEGSHLSGSKLKEFLKKNFLDFADDEFKKIEALADVKR